MSTESKYRHVFGPVPSRRLGRSLGVDIIPLKTCTFDCVYCQVGRTTDLTVDRAEFVPLEEVVGEVRRRLAEGAAPDYITLSGSGEPTLYSRLGELIHALKALSDVPVAVITNGSLLWREDVRRDLLEADLVVPSLDAADAETYNRVNRPHPSIGFEDVVSGLVQFREEYGGTLWLEVFLLRETASEEQVRRLAGLVGRIRPDRVQVNTVARPPADADARPLAPDELACFAGMLGDRAEVISDFAYQGHASDRPPRTEDVMDLLRRRPCSLEDICEGPGLSRLEVIKTLAMLEKEGAIVRENRNGRVYYSACKRGG